MAERRNTFGCQNDRGSRADGRHEEAAATLRAHTSEWSFPLPAERAASLTPLQHLLDSASQQGASASAVAPRLDGECDREIRFGGRAIACFAHGRPCV